MSLFGDILRCHVHKIVSRSLRCLHDNPGTTEFDPWNGLQITLTPITIKNQIIETKKVIFDCIPFKFTLKLLCDFSDRVTHPLKSIPWMLRTTSEPFPYRHGQWAKLSLQAMMGHQWKAHSILRIGFQRPRKVIACIDRQLLRSIYIANIRWIWLDMQSNKTPLLTANKAHMKNRSEFYKPFHLARLS